MDLNNAGRLKTANTWWIFDKFKVAYIKYSEMFFLKINELHAKAILQIEKLSSQRSSILAIHFSFQKSC